MKQRSLIFLTLLLLPISAIAEKDKVKDKAEFKKKLMEFYHSFDTPANYTKAEIYQSQKAGHATGGGIVIRNRIKELQPVTVSLPKMDAGCGGIDIYAGGFSYINSDELIDTLKSIGTSASGYAFLLAMETVSPQVANSIKQLQSWSNTINSIGINSCETASTIVGSVWPRETMAREQLCRSAASSKGIGSDYIARRQQCSDINKRTEEFDQYTDNKDTNIVIHENNLTWEALKKQSYVTADHILSEIMMNIVGTVISKKDSDGSLEKEYYPSRLSDDTFLKFLLEGGTEKIYKCENNKDNKCLTIVLEEVKISREESWLGQIQKNLEDIQYHVLTDTELDDAQKDFLTRTRIPLYQVVNVLTAYRNGQCPIDLYQVAEIVSVDLLLQYLQEAVAAVDEGCQHLKSTQEYDFVFEDFISLLHKAQSRVQYYEFKEHLFDRELQLMQTVDMLHQKLVQQIKFF